MRPGEVQVSLCPNLDLQEGPGPASLSGAASPAPGPREGRDSVASPGSSRCWGTGLMGSRALHSWHVQTLSLTNTTNDQPAGKQGQNDFHRKSRLRLLQPWEEVPGGALDGGRDRGCERAGVRGQGRPSFTSVSGRRPPCSSVPILPLSPRGWDISAPCGQALAPNRAVQGCH